MINVRMQHKEVRKLSPKITVVGVGGAGGNAVNNMISTDLQGVEFLVCNTDAQALEGSYCENKIQLGAEITGGLGAGAKPEIGEAAAEETLEEVMQFLEGSNMAFITAGMGGGTGTGAAPIIARACRELGILTVGVVTKPFHFEGTLRMRMADEGIEKMQDFVDTLIVIPNQNLFRVANEKTTFAEAFRMADSVLQSGVRGVTDLMVMPGLINLDFADVRSAMLEMGKAMMGTGEAEGERRSTEAAEAAINNPLLDDVTMKGARGVIINVTGGTDMTLFEVDEACNRVRDEVDPNANIIFGSTFDEKLDGMMRVSIVATGIDIEEQVGSGVSHKGLNTSLYGRKTPTENTGGKIERAKPNTVSDTVAEGESASVTAVASSVPAASLPQSPFGNAIPTAPSVSTGDIFASQEEIASKEAPKATPPMSALDLSVKVDAQPKGTIYKDSFIPPAPVMVDKNAYQSAPVATPAEEVVTEQVEIAAPTTMSMVDKANAENTAEKEELSAPALKLNPPVPGGNREQKTKSASLFDRFKKNPLGLGREETEEEDSRGSRSGSASGSAAPSLHAPKRPEQGSLNIDAPKLNEQEGQADDELDIPAFLRRQAN